MFDETHELHGTTDAAKCGRPSLTEERWHWERAAKATDKLLSFLIERHPNDPEWAKYSSRQIAKPGKSIQVPENPAPPDVINTGAPLPAGVSGTGRRGVPAFVPGRIQRVMIAAADHFSISVADIMGPKQHAPIVRVRQIVMYLSFEIPEATSASIGRRINRDHSTIISGVKKIERLLPSDEKLTADVEAVRALAVAADPGLAQ